MNIIKFCQQNAHYVLSIIAILYGLFYKDTNAVIIGLVGLGLSSSISSKVADIIAGQRA